MYTSSGGQNSTSHTSSSYNQGAYPRAAHQEQYRGYNQSTKYNFGGFQRKEEPAHKKTAYDSYGDNDEAIIGLYTADTKVAKQVPLSEVLSGNTSSNAGGQDNMQFFAFEDSNQKKEAPSASNAFDFSDY